MYCLIFIDDLFIIFVNISIWLSKLFLTRIKSIWCFLYFWGLVYIL